MDDRCCTSLLYGHKKGHVRRWNMACDLVGDTGIEPVTSSVSRNDHGGLTSDGGSQDQARRSTRVRGRLAEWMLVVTQLDTHAAGRFCPVMPPLTVMYLAI
jgi:hypothetical protein